MYAWAWARVADAFREDIAGTETITLDFGTDDTVTNIIDCPNHRPGVRSTVIRRCILNGLLPDEHKFYVGGLISMHRDIEPLLTKAVLDLFASTIEATVKCTAESMGVSCEETVKKFLRPNNHHNYLHIGVTPVRLSLRMAEDDAQGFLAQASPRRRERPDT